MAAPAPINWYRVGGLLFIAAPWAVFFAIWFAMHRR